MRNTKQHVLQFWFEETDPRVWFQVSESFDDRIRDEFHAVYDLARQGLTESWAVDASGALALILVLNQFPRRMFRGKPEAYATDTQALLIAKQSVHKGFDQILPPEQRFFMYLPFEHSEQMSDQKRNLDLFKAMETENPLAYRTACRHFETFEKFGRFPERNAALGRINTPEEEAWLNGGL